MSPSTVENDDLPEVIQSDLSIQTEPVTTIEPEKLRPHPRNEKVYGEDEALESSFVESVDENGVLEPLVVNRDHRIISGHRRWKAAQATDTSEVPVRVVGFDDELQEREALIEFNRQRDKTAGQVINEFDEILEVEKQRAEQRMDQAGGPTETFPEGETGEARDKAAEKIDSPVSGRTLEKGKDVKDIAEGDTEEEKPEKVKQKAEKEWEKLQNGDTSISAAKRSVKRTEKEAEREQEAEETPEVEDIVCGDSCEKLEALPDDSVDCVVTDPPYGIDYESNHTNSKDIVEGLQGDQSSEDAFRLLSDVLDTLEAKLKDDAHAYIFCSWKTLPGMMQVVRQHFQVKSLLNWEKNNHGMGDLQGSYAEKYEYVIFATKGNRKLNYDKRPTNKFKADRVVGGDQTHPTEKPVSLLKKLIKYSTIEGETVVDPFAGTGSTLEAAEVLDRDWFGVEVKEEYVEKASVRISEVRQ